MTEKKRSVEAAAADAWDWRDHFEEFVNADISSQDFSQTLWDELTQNDLELRSLFSTPNIDALLVDSATLFQSSCISSGGSSNQESSVEGDSDAAVLLRGDENPRLKKRRLFQQTTTFSNEDDICEDAAAAAIEEASAMMIVPPPVQSFADPLTQDEEEGHGILSSMPAIWYASNDDSRSCLGDNQMEEPPVMMMSSENWMAICVEDNNNDTMGLNGFHNHMKKAKKKKEEAVGIAKQKPTGGLTPLKISNEEVVLQGPLTPFCSRPSTPVNRTIAVKKASRSTPVAYPFTLVKPLGIEGDMTLMDINQLISTTPPRNNNDNDDFNNTNTTTTTTHDGSSSSGGSSNSSSSNSTNYTRDPRANTKGVDYGVGLSGKSIVTRTRICTKGNGTITIMRTKG